MPEDNDELYDTEQDREELNRAHYGDEIRRAVFDMSPQSAAGLNDFNGGNNKSIKLIVRCINDYEKISGQKVKGGIGIRSMEEINTTLAVKRWWRYRTIPSLWDEFLDAKYCSGVQATARRTTNKIFH
ncbi:hypothetical protein HAX54_025408 [Datura stramonium]|uniref:Uncharacterized protein n=1 Tax=Datura stramonium TaxID=4076 RepID=A0ABS8UZI1_DATST|nr:hypothetical protein [Datura stramonium]